MFTIVLPAWLSYVSLYYLHFRRLSFSFPLSVLRRLLFPFLAMGGIQDSVSIDEHPQEIHRRACGYYNVD